MSTFDQPKRYGAKKSSYPNDMARSHAELMSEVLVEWNESGVYGQVELLVGHWSTIDTYKGLAQNTSTKQAPTRQVQFTGTHAAYPPPRLFDPIFYCILLFTMSDYEMDPSEGDLRVYAWTGTR